MSDVGAGAVPLVDIWRGGRLESQHRGHAVVCDASGVVEAWGDPGAVIYPRSSCKMLQALPLLESGAGAALDDRRLALACASHQGSAMHVAAVSAWLAEMGLAEADLRCGAHEPTDIPERNRLICTGDAFCQLHNNCSGKHAGFLMLNRHLGGGTEYVEVDHPVQKAVRAAFEEVTGEDSPGYGIDGCSAPNFATSLGGLARAMARFATAEETGARGRAMVRLRSAMARHPEMVAGETRACTELMRAMDGVAIKTGAEAVFVAIVPSKGLGVALKVVDGGTRASEAAIVGLLARLGVLDAGHPAALKRLGAPQRNWRGFAWGEVRLSAGFC
ncbi:MAG: asparaginase [Rhodobacter sp.]|uniref:asparaginase n=1 Tax=Pararhodobacter sp. TaxID=2127056 RepID=UPI002C76E4FB|nr:asparaginase [Pararhodobacter sp.]MCC0073527.1 asparaginase [Rhodobacter sp.]HPD91824.1 asparaginase [Pararhodobacter sp.]